MVKIGYARVSTNEQNPELQITALEAADCARIFVDKVSAVGKERPAFEKALAAVQPGDALCVWRLDRAFRSTMDALLIWEQLRERSVQLIISTLGLVSDTPEGRYFFRGLASAAEFERDLIRARTKEGMASAKARGVHVGRPRALSAEQVIDVNRMHREGLSPSQLAERCNVSEATIRRVLKVHCEAKQT